MSSCGFFHCCLSLLVSSLLCTVTLMPVLRTDGGKTGWVRKPLTYTPALSLCLSFCLDVSRPLRRTHSCCKQFSLCSLVWCWSIYELLFLMKWDQMFLFFENQPCTTFWCSTKHLVWLSFHSLGKNVESWFSIHKRCVLSVLNKPELAAFEEWKRLMRGLCVYQKPNPWRIKALLSS